MWPWLLQPCFPHIKRRNRTQAYVFKRLNEIRRLRNRIFHHERIWHLPELPNLHAQIIDVINWITPDTGDYLASIDRFDRVVNRGMPYYFDKVATDLLQQHR